MPILKTHHELYFATYVDKHTYATEFVIWKLSNMIYAHLSAQMQTANIRPSGVTLTFNLLAHPLMLIIICAK